MVLVSSPRALVRAGTELLATMGAGCSARRHSRVGSQRWLRGVADAASIAITSIIRSPTQRGDRRLAGISSEDSACHLCVDASDRIPLLVDRFEPTRASASAEGDRKVQSCDSFV